MDGWMDGRSKGWMKQLSMHAHIQLEDELVWVCREVHVHFFCQSCHRSEELEGQARLRLLARVCTHWLSGMMALQDIQTSHTAPGLPENMSGSCKTSYEQVLGIIEIHFCCIVLFRQTAKAGSGTGEGYQMPSFNCGHLSSTISKFQK